MKKIIEEVLQTEEKVGAILTQAREKASEIRLAAEKDVSEKMNDARQKAQQIMRGTLDDAKKQAEQIREEKLKQAEHDKDAILQENAERIDGLVDNICKIVLSTQPEKDEK